jgi:DNA-binding MarR family transcriptional regulator
MTTLLREERSMTRTIPARLSSFTPVMDQMVQEVGFITAAVFGVAWRYCQMDDGVCHASLRTLAGKLGLDPATVMRHLHKLAEAGYLEDTTPERRNVPHTYRDTGKATLRMELAAEVRPTPPARAEADRGNGHRERRQEEPANAPAAAVAEINTVLQPATQCCRESVEDTSQETSQDSLSQPCDEAPAEERLGLDPKTLEVRRLLADTAHRLHGDTLSRNHKATMRAIRGRLAGRPDALAMLEEAIRRLEAHGGGSLAYLDQCIRNLLDTQEPPAPPPEPAPTLYKSWITGEWEDARPRRAHGHA